MKVKYSLPFNPLKDRQQYADSINNDWGMEFSHTLEEQIGGQLEAGFTLTYVMEDINSEGNLHDHNIPLPVQSNVKNCTGIIKYGCTKAAVFLFGEKNISIYVQALTGQRNCV